MWQPTEHELATQYWVTTCTLKNPALVSVWSDFQCNSMQVRNFITCVHLFATVIIIDLTSFAVWISLSGVQENTKMLMATLKCCHFASNNKNFP